MVPVKWKNGSPGTIFRTYPSEMRFALAIATFTGHSGAGWVKMMGLKELFTIRMGYFHPYSQYSSIPAFHPSILMA